MKLSEPKNPVDFNEIDAHLAGDIEGRLGKWFSGKKIVRTGDWFAIGTHGSLKVHSHDGHWVSHETEDRGPGLLSLYSWNLGRPIREAALEFSDEVLPPVTRRPEPPLPGHPQGEPSQVYRYRDEAGRLKGAVLRFDQGDSKTFRQAALVDEKWHWRAMEKPRPLYRAEDLRLKPTAQVVLVEGEKAAEALREALPEAVVLTWPGGASAVDQANWKPLESRVVTIWPDNDAAGAKAAKKVREHLPQASILDVSELGPKQDAADVAGIWTPEQLREFIGAGQVQDQTLFEKLQIRKFDPANLTPEKRPILSLGDSPVLYSGNLMTVTGQDKSGKSHIEAAIARAITAPGSRQLGFTSSAGGRICYLDFEQDRNDFENLLIRSGCDPEQISGYHLTGFNAQEAKAALTAIMEGEHDLRACLIDGFADLLNDVNDASESNQLVAELMAMAEKHEVAIIGVLHLNPGSESKTRGHLGSQLSRKSQTVLQIKVDTDGTRTVFTQKARKKPIPESQGVRFAWCEDSHGFVEIEGTPGEVKQAAKVDEWTRMLYDIQAHTAMLAWKNKDLNLAIRSEESVSERTAQTRIKQLLKAGLLKHCASRGVYTSTLKGANDPK